MIEQDGGNHRSGRVAGDHRCGTGAGRRAVGVTTSRYEDEVQQGLAAEEEAKELQRCQRARSGREGEPECECARDDQAERAGE